MADGTSVSNRRWVLNSRPEGLFSASNNASLVTENLDTTSLESEELVIQVETLSVDAFLRTMLDEEAYHGSVPLGSTLPAMGIGQVIAAGPSAKLSVGTKCMGMLGAQTYSKLTPGVMGPMKLLKLPGVPEVASLGLLGLTTGITAWVGMFKVLGAPKRGETVVVTAAAGAVGMIASQLALTTGARVIGVAGGEKKVVFLTDTLHLTGAINYKSTTETFADQLEKLCPDGIDFMMDQVGGSQLDDCLRQINPGGRVVICGAVSQYSGNLNKGKVEGPSEYLKLAEKGATMKGFNVMQYMTSLPMAVTSLLWHWNMGRVVVHEQVEDGIDSFAPAMEKMFSGGHIGRLLVKIGV